MHLLVGIQGRVACIFGVAIAVVSFLYIALGLSTVYYFGDLVKPSININWEKFRFGVAWDTQLPIGRNLLHRRLKIAPADDDCGGLVMRSHFLLSFVRSFVRCAL